MIRPQMTRLALRLLAAATCAATLAGAQEIDESNERIRLYTEPDPSAPGGITGRIASPQKALLQVLAIPPDAPEKVYAAKLDGEGTEFRFTGLPMRKYDLIAIFEDSFYEGLQLHRGESTLTPDDLEKIEEIITRSEPFFTKKVIHRVEGETGRANLSRCITTFVREKSSITYIDPSNAAKSGKGYFRRTFKLVLLKDVGPGWQIARARDLYPKWVDPKVGLPSHHFSEALSGIRVADKIKDLGELDLDEE